MTVLFESKQKAEKNQISQNSSGKWTWQNPTKPDQYQSLDKTMKMLYINLM